MKKFLTVLVTLLFSLSVTAFAAAQETPAPAKTAPQMEQQNAAPAKKTQTTQKKTKKKKSKKTTKKGKTAKKAPTDAPAEGAK